MADRLPADRGWCDQRKLPRGPNGRALCRQCNTEVPKGRRTFCSEQCVARWKETRDVGYQRRKVWDRDAGICQRCRIDLAARQERLKRINHLLRLVEHGSFVSARHYRRARPDLARRRSEQARDAMITMGWPVRKDRWSTQIQWSAPLWEMDHIVPVVLGGGACSLDNLRVLCRPCHVAVTAELRRELARRRRSEKVAQHPQRRLFGGSGG